MELQLKKKIHKISLWLKISFLKEKQSYKSLMFMYETTLRKSWSFEVFLEKVVQLGWFGTPTSCSPSSIIELGMDCVNCSYEHFVKIFWYFYKSCLNTTYSWANWLFSTVMKFLVFSEVSLLIKLMLLEGV